MDIRHYFDPVDFKRYNSESSNWKYSFGSGIEKDTLKLNTKNINNTDIAIIGIPYDSRSVEHYNYSINKIRAELYQLAAPGRKNKIVDLGNLKIGGTPKGMYLAIRDIVEYLNESGVITVIIGGSIDLSIGVCQAFQNNRFFSYSTIDALLKVKKGRESFSHSNYLTRIFSSNPDLFQFNLIGYHVHFENPYFISKTRGISENIRLGNLRENINLAEPVMRNTDFLSFDIGAIKYSEAPGSGSYSPNGLRSEEACQLTKYAGLSNRLKVLGLFGADWENKSGKLTEKLASQILWYFMEGAEYRKPEKPEDDNMLIYKVEIESVDEPLVFVRSSLTDRWWLKVIPHTKIPYYVACSEKEYKIASNNEIPELWLKFVQKTDELLK